MRRLLFGLLPVSVFFLLALIASSARAEDPMIQTLWQQPLCRDANGTPHQPLAIGDKNGRVKVTTPTGGETIVKMRRPYPVVCGNHLFKTAEKRCVGDSCRYDPKPRRARFCKRNEVPNPNRICEHVMTSGPAKPMKRRR